MKKLLAIAFGAVMSTQGFAQWLPNGATSGSIYYNGGSVGIGTASPITQLTMVDANMGGPVNTSITPNMGLSLTGNGTGGTLNMGIDATGANFYSWIQSRNRTNTGTYSIALNPAGGNVGIGTTAPQTKLDLGELRFDKISAFPSEGSILEGPWGNYIIGDVNTLQRLRLGVSNDGYTRAEIFLDNSNRPDGTISFRTANANGGAQTRVFVDGSANVGIGNTNPDAKLTVSGQVHAQEVKVTVNAPGPDYVFEKDYALPSLDQIKNYIEENKHLPEVPSAKEMEKNGVQLGEMNMLLLKKIEELTLYVIELKRRDEVQQREIEQLKANK